MSSRIGVRAAIVGIFALLATAVTVAEVRSQPGRPGFPRPGGMPGMPRPGSGFRGPMFEDVWYCGGCRAELGRGPVKPSYASCPKCGVRFANGGGPGLFNPPPPAAGAPNMSGMPNGGGSSPPPAAPVDPDLSPRGAPGIPTATPGVSAAPTFPSSGATPSTSPGPGSNTDSQSASSTSSSSSESGSKTGSLILKIMVGVFGLLFLLGIVGGTILIISANKGQKTPRRRKARDLDDDD